MVEFFFVIHFVVGNLMVFNTFIGVLIEKFNDIKKKLFNSSNEISHIYPGMKPDYISELDGEEKNWVKIKE